MKLFNAQSAEKQITNANSKVVENKDLDNKVLFSKELLISVAGGVNEVVRPWPPTDLSPK